MTGNKSEAVRVFIERGMWEVSREKSPRAIYLAGKALQWVNALMREMTVGGLTLRAMSLVYTTLLSLVPLLAVSFSVLKAFGVHNQLEPFLLHLFEPLGAQGHDVATNIIGFVENMKVGVLGTVGFVVLFYTVVSLLSTLEETFNHIWRTRKARSFLRRFSDYLSVIMIGPVLVFSALGLTATMASADVVQEIIAIAPFGIVFYVAGIILPYLFLIAAFTFCYLFMCTAKVDFKAALVGGTFAALGWNLAGWAFTTFVAGSTKYAAIYSSFAIMIIFMIWVYVCWLILLLGAQIAFFFQYPRYIRSQTRHPRLSNRLKERAGMFAMYLIARNFFEGKPPWSLRGLNERLNLPMEVVRNILHILKRSGLILVVDEDAQTFVPARDIGSITVAEVLQALRRGEEEKLAADEQALSSPPLDRLLSKVDTFQAETLGAATLRDMVAEP